MLLVVAVFVVAISGSGVSAQLSPDFYATSCLTALSIIKMAIESAVSQEPRMGASLLRLHFHDCFVNGCDGSVLLNDTDTFTGERSAIANGGLRGFDVIDNIKTQLENICPGVVSCADILTVAARDSTVALNGPSWNVVLGRKDSTTASLSDANRDMPLSGLSLSGLISSFSSKGFTPDELVALSGSHTIGQARCVTFRNRIYNDTNINPILAILRQGNCPTSGGNDNLAPLDSTSPTAFDNAYYFNLLFQGGLLHSDQELFNGNFSIGSTDLKVLTYVLNSASFFTDFANAMVKMGNLSPSAGTIGEIRTNCGRVNEISFLKSVGVINHNSKSHHFNVI